MSLKEEILKAQKWLEVTLEQEKQMKMFKNCSTIQEIFGQHKGSHQGLVFKRIPLLDCSAPREEVKNADRLLCYLLTDSYSTIIQIVAEVLMWFK